MQWQDIVIALCQTGFILALIPTIRGTHKPATSTAIMTATLVTIITFCLFTLKLWFAAVTSFGVGVAWLILAVQKIKIEKNNKL